MEMRFWLVWLVLFWAVACGKKDHAGGGESAPAPGELTLHEGLRNTLDEAALEGAIDELLTAQKAYRNEVPADPCDFKKLPSDVLASPEFTVMFPATAISPADSGEATLTPPAGGEGHEVTPASTPDAAYLVEWTERRTSAELGIDLTVRTAYGGNERYVYGKRYAGDDQDEFLYERASKVIRYAHRGPSVAGEGVLDDKQATIDFAKAKIDLTMHISDDYRYAGSFHREGPVVEGEYEAFLSDKLSPAFGTSTSGKVTHTFQVKERKGLPTCFE